MEFRHSNGILKIEQRGNIVVARFKGAINARMAEFLIQGFEKLVNSGLQAPWGYVSDSIGIHAATPDAVPLLIKSVQYCIAHGCVSSAYVSDSVVAVDQMDKVLKASGLRDGIVDKVFDSQAQAEDYVLATISSFRQQQSMKSG